MSESMGLLDLLIDWFIKPFVEAIFDWLGQLFIIENMYNVFYVEDILSLSGDIINQLQNFITVAAATLLAAKLLHKLFNIYIIGVDGDNTTSPLEYVKSYGKALVIIFCFTTVYQWFGRIIMWFMEATNGILNSGGWGTVLDHLDMFDLLFAFIYFVIAIVFYISTIITGIRMLVLRLALPLSCVGIIDNDNGIYSVFIKKIMQTAITVVAQIVLFQISLIPVKGASDLANMTFLSYILASAVLLYAMKVPQDLNEIFLAAPQTGAGQKISQIGKSVAGMFSGAKGG